MVDTAVGCHDKVSPAYNREQRAELFGRVEQVDYPGMIHLEVIAIVQPDDDGLVVGKRFE